MRKKTRSEDQSDPPRLQDLSEAQERAVQTALTLQSSARKRIEQRRSYEWKVTLGIWTALVLAGREFLTRPDISSVGVTMFASVILLLHFAWILGYVGPSNRRDGKEAVSIERSVRFTIGIPDPEPDRSYSWVAQWVEILFTASLLLALIFLVSAA